MKREFIGHYALSISVYGNVYITSVLDKYGKVTEEFTNLNIQAAMIVYDRLVRKYTDIKRKEVFA